jgi:hypothetical protein
MKQAVAAQKRRTITARKLTRAELDLDFFCIGGRNGALVVAYAPGRVNMFRSFPDVVRQSERRGVAWMTVKLCRDPQLRILTDRVIDFLIRINACK